MSRQIIMDRPVYDDTLDGVIRSSQGTFRSVGYKLIGVMVKCEENDPETLVTDSIFKELPVLRIFGDFSKETDPATLLRTLSEAFAKDRRLRAQYDAKIRRNQRKQQKIRAAVERRHSGAGYDPSIN